MKIVYSDRKTGKSAQREVPKEKESLLIGKKMREQIEGSIIGLEGYKFEIRGLSDKTGAPSRIEIDGIRKSWPLLSSGPGAGKVKKGLRKKRIVRGNTISPETEQINTVVVEYGTLPAEEAFKTVKKEGE
ncbi:MAG: S6e family ribosomal protein [Candidatus Micrarchaeia archaeon]